jgi:hypothetical protein
VPHGSVDNCQISLQANTALQHVQLGLYQPNLLGIAADIADALPAGAAEAELIDNAAAAALGVDESLAAKRF